MTNEQASEILRVHNLWRRNQDDVNPYEMCDPKELGIAIEVAIEALEQLAQKPYCWTGYGGQTSDKPVHEESIPLYIHPVSELAQGIELEWYNKGWDDAKKEFIGLTDDELSKLFAKCGWVEESDNLHTLGFYKHARILEQALKEKNHG